MWCGVVFVEKVEEGKKKVLQEGDGLETAVRGKKVLKYVTEGIVGVGNFLTG